MRTLIINNLKSGLGTGAIYDFIRKLVADGDEIVLRSTNGQTRIETLLDDAHTYDLVVAAGGDSTVTTVSYVLRDTQIPILPFPAGTGNLTATNLDIPAEPVALVKLAKEALYVDYDLGELSFDVNGKRRTKGFGVIAGAGFDARIMEDSERLKGVLGPMAYVASAISTPTPTVAHFKITLDDEVLELDGIAVLVINFAEIFPHISITHENDARDGFFEVVVLKAQRTIELLPAIISAFLDRGGAFPGRTDAVAVRRSRTVYVESDPPLAIQYDGEVAGAVTPFEAQMIPRSTRYVVGKDEYDRHNERAAG